MKVWDALAEKGKQFDLHAAGMLALDVARVEAGLLLIEVDYTSSKKALIPSQKYSPYELGFGKMVHLEKENFIGKRALEHDAKNGVARQLVGVEVDWTDVEALYERYGLTPAAPSQASRVAVPLYSGEKQVGKATTTSWSPILKKMIALASVETEHAKLGTQLQMEITIEAIRLKTNVKVTATAILQSGRGRRRRRCNSPPALLWGSAAEEQDPILPLPIPGFSCQCRQCPDQPADIRGRNRFFRPQRSVRRGFGLLPPGFEKRGNRSPIVCDKG